jgi:pseudouridine-5'-phosphate glycosidase
MMIQIDEKVKAALKSGRPVVALESTIVAHGMPYPENLHLSQRVATILRDKGVEPATIGTYVQQFAFASAHEWWKIECNPILFFNRSVSCYKL